MSFRRRLRLVSGDTGPLKPERPLPACDYSGDLTNDQIESIRARVKPEIEAGNWKTVDGPAW